MKSKRFAAVDVHVLRDRAETVRRVEIPVAVFVMRRSPHTGAALGVVHLFAEVVDVGGLAVSELAEEALAAHVEHHELFASVANVLHHHAVSSAALLRFDEAPAFVDRHRRRHLDERVLAGLHGVHGHRCVPSPRCRDHDDVEVGALEHAAVVLVTARVLVGARAALCLAIVEMLARRRGVVVAKCFDLDTFEEKKLSEVESASCAEADEPDANGVERRHECRLHPGRQGEARAHPADRLQKIVYGLP